MFRRRIGAGAPSIAIVAVLLVAVTGLVAYEVVSSPSAIASSSSSSHSSVTPMTTSSGSSTGSTSSTTETSAASTTSTNSTSCDPAVPLSNSTRGGIAPLLSTFSAMKFQYNFTTGGQAGNFTKFASLNYTESYTTAYVSSTTYKVNLVSVWGGENTTTTSWILKNGTVIAIYENGQNVTGLQLQQAAIALDGIFPAQIPADSPLSAFVTSLGIGMQPNGNSTATFGSNTFTVANYAPKTLPVQIVVGCGVSGSPLTAALTAFQMSVGEPKGTSIDLVTSSEIAISYSFAASVLMDSVATQLISFTVR